MSKIYAVMDFIDGDPLVSAAATFGCKEQARKYYEWVKMVLDKYGEQRIEQRIIELDFYQSVKDAINK